jgi:hypothetical protein
VNPVNSILEKKINHTRRIWVRKESTITGIPKQCTGTNKIDGYCQ